MAYALTNPIRRIGPQGAGNGVWYYKDGDALSVIDGLDYFVLEADKLKVDDIILAVGNNVAGFAVVNAVTTGASPSVDVSNFTAQTTVDSD